MNEEDLQTSVTRGGPWGSDMHEGPAYPSRHCVRQLEAHVNGDSVRGCSNRTVRHCVSDL